MAAACASLPGAALASNMTHPRTPVLWEDVPCLTLHDRSADPILHLPYGIPFEDLEITMDEVPDSRTHQFFAFCRPHHPQDFLPTWITEADVAAAIAVGIIEPGEVETDDIMALSPAWTDCWFRINADDERRPISDAMADAGVEWDTAAVPAGVYTIDGYTYEPEFNIWYLRPGVVKVHDGDPHAVGPAAAISTGELTPYRDDEVLIEGCVHAVPETTFTVYWAETVMDVETMEWVEYLTDQPLAGPDFAFPFSAPEALWGETGLIRVDFTDPQGRTYTAYQADPLLVIDNDNPADCDDGGFVAGACGTSSGDGGSSTGDAGTSTGTGSTGTDTAAGSTGTGGGSGPGQDDLLEGARGCGCRTTDDGAPGLVVLAIVAPVLRRRRRR